VAEKRARLAPPEQDPLAELNDHLGRFLRQADELLDEWARFGAGVRARLDEQLADVEAAFARGADSAAARAAQAMARGLDDAAAARVDRALGDRVAALRAELERLERIARGVGAAPAAAKAPDPALQRIWIAVIATNVLVVALIAIVWMRGGSSAATPPRAIVSQPAVAPPIDAAPPPPDAPPPDASPLDASPPDASPARPPARAVPHRPAPAHP
jgi:hypothetical protein